MLAMLHMVLFFVFIRWAFSCHAMDGLNPAPPSV